MDEKRDSLRIDDLSDRQPLTKVISDINKRFNTKLNERRENGILIQHNLEYGLGSENVLRELLAEVLPSKYGVGKGKIVSSSGNLSNHLDIIIFDKLNYPTFYTDENRNLIVPIESVYCVIEVKVRTDSGVLKKAFEGLESVSDIAGVTVKSTNELVDYRPPKLVVFSFQDERSLETIKENFCRLSDEFQREWSFSRYAEKSPGHERDNGHQYLVSSVYILGLGQVYSMLDGSVAIGRWGEHTFSMLISSLLSDLNHIDLGKYTSTSYVHWLGAGIREIYER